MEITINVSDERISDLIISALEGGSNYWCLVECKPGMAVNDCLETLKSDTSVFISNVFGDSESGSFNKETIAKGLKLVAEKYPTRFAEIISENDNVDTADVFLQCCVFGDVIYC